MTTTLAAADAPSTELTADGVPYAIRSIGVADAARERAFICGLSEASRYSRLMYAVREPSAAFIDQMVNVNYRRTMAFVAVVGEGDAESIIGVARYADSPGGSGSEFAIAVADEWQSRGVGSALAHRLFDYARRQGLLRMCASISATNSRMLSLAHWLGFTTGMTPGESSLLSAQLVLAPAPLLTSTG
jgi:acetyltransferase